MKARRLIILMLILMLGLPSVLSAQVTLKDGQLLYKSGGANLSLDLGQGAVTPVAGSDLVFAYVDDEEALKAAKRKPGLLFFNKGGRLMGSFEGLDGFDPTMCSSASLSPGGRTLALDNGTWLVRVWTFLDYPAFSQASRSDEFFLSYLSNPDGRDLTWVDDDMVLVTDLSEAPVSRPCPSDPCEPLDVVLHQIRAGASQALAKGTELCNYTFRSLEGKTVTVDKTCTKNLDDWAELNDLGRPVKGTVTQEKVTLPDLK